MGGKRPAPWCPDVDVEKPGTWSGDGAFDEFYLDWRKPDGAAAGRVVERELIGFTEEK